MKMDWKKMGFKTEAEYHKFLDDKMKSFINRITSTPELLNVFKRLKDR
jgi:Glu-tRNA(Gln) amidotransferase subunit E-like FAD-binding protein